MKVIRGRARTNRVFPPPPPHCAAVQGPQPARPSTPSLPNCSLLPLTCCPTLQCLPPPLSPPRCHLGEHTVTRSGEGCWVSLIRYYFKEPKTAVSQTIFLIFTWGIFRTHFSAETGAQFSFTGKEAPDKSISNKTVDHCEFRIARKS